MSFNISISLSPDYQKSTLQTYDILSTGYQLMENMKQCHQNE